MTIAFRDLATLDVAGVQARLLQLQTRLQEAFPSLFLQRGVFHDTEEMLAAILEEQLGENVDDYLSARSLMDILADPTLGDEDAVNAVLSNFLLIRQPGAPATGEIAIIVDNDATVTIAAGSTFQARGLIFTATDTFSAKVEEDQVILDTDRLLSPVGDGTYRFTVDIVCETAGAAGMLIKDEAVVPDTLPTGYVASFVANDFTGGVDEETNAELMARQQQGFAPPGLCNQANFAAVLRTTPAFARVTAQSVVGYGDPEMLRDKHTIFPVALGGRVDWYVRTQPQYARQTLTKTAVLVSKDGPVGTWQVAMLRDDAPGFYEVESILLPGVGDVGSFEVASIVPGYDFSTDTWHPDIVNALEAAFSRYQTALLQFIDTVTDVSALVLGSTQDYEVSVKALPLVGDIQDAVASDTGRSRAGDVLVKAAVPCLMTINFTIVKAAGQADPDLTAIAQAVADAVNAVGFTGTLYASVVTAAVAPLLLTGQSLRDMDLLGRIVYPDGSNVTVRDPEKLVVPEDPALMVGARTVQFFAVPDEVHPVTV